MADSSRVRNLIAALEELDASWGVERTKRADVLLDEAHAALIEAGDCGVWQQSRPGNGTRKSVAADLGVSVNYVQKRTSRYATSRK